MPPPNTALRRILKLRQLARGASGHEATSAAALARAIMAQAHLTEDTVLALEAQLADALVSVGEVPREFAWQELAAACAGAHGCRAGWSPDNRILGFYGPAGAAKTASDLFLALAAAVASFAVCAAMDDRRCAF